MVRDLLAGFCCCFLSADPGIPELEPAGAVLCPRHKAGMITKNSEHKGSRLQHSVVYCFVLSLQTFHPHSSTRPGSIFLGSLNRLEMSRNIVGYRVFSIFFYPNVVG